MLRHIVILTDMFKFIFFTVLKNFLYILRYILWKMNMFLIKFFMNVNYTVIKLFKLLLAWFLIEWKIAKYIFRCRHKRLKYFLYWFLKLGCNTLIILWFILKPCFLFVQHINRMRSMRLKIMVNLWYRFNLLWLYIFFVLKFDF